MKKPSEKLKDDVRGSTTYMSKKQFAAVTLISVLVTSGVYVLFSFLLNPGPFVMISFGIIMLVGMIFLTVGNYRKRVARKKPPQTL